MRGEVAKHGGVDQLVGDLLHAKRVSRADGVRQGAPRTVADEIGVARPKQDRIKHPVFLDEKDDGRDGGCP